MSTRENASSASNDLAIGSLCLMTAMGQHFMVRIVEREGDHVRVSFPGSDYPIDGMLVDLEFHDETGFTCYRARVVAGPRKRDEGMRLQLPHAPTRTHHRDTCRVPTDLTVQVKDQAHVRRYDAAIVNLSAGGALIRTAAPFDYTTTLEVALSLPGQASHTLIGQIVHVSAGPAGPNGPEQLIGIRFVGMEPVVARLIVDYVWGRLRTMYELA